MMADLRVGRGSVPALRGGPTTGGHVAGGWQAAGPRMANRGGGLQDNMQRAARPCAAAIPSQHFPAAWLLGAGGEA